MQEAECEKAKMDIKYKADAAIADSSREFKMQKAHFDSEVNTKVGPHSDSVSLCLWSLSWRILLSQKLWF
jgi:hypothetical protein